MIISWLVSVLLGLGGGLAVGGGLVALITVLGVIPRLAQLSRSEAWVRFYEWAGILGIQVGTWASFYSFQLSSSRSLAAFVGLLAGVFIGLLAAALTEVLNVWPILVKRMGMGSQILFLLMAIALGKIAGSLFQWLWFTL
ncbi:stage V sporulation protein AB [Alkalicoccobacillus murimartini]|uniref:Stage V sporulation protein AB n=1 Tax=Alkalicoccobacillus murimartini TaxID=171685 RepID=A0ABT9YD79_9BACI|nr:stage V sporulation protein AB [Alkalicoccobacillus murimartini]MDQ0205803.1 stage V sporulation protein AB [Alkalicoccobacillus murimartini]